VLLSYYEKGKQIAEANSKTTFTIEPETSNAQNNQGGKCAITYEDYQWVIDEYPDVLTASYFLHRHICAITSGEELDTNEIDLIYAPDKYFNECGYKGDVNNKVFAGKNIYDRLNNVNTVFSIYDEVKFGKNNTMDIGNSKGLNIIPLSKLKLKDKTMNFGSILITTVNVDDGIFIPCSVLDEYFEMDSVNVSFKISFLNGGGNEILSEILSQLGTRHNNAYSYKATNIKANYDWSNERIVLIIKNRVMYAIIVFMILLFGFTGILHIITYKRRKQIAISIMLGGDEKTVLIELFIELWAVCIMGAAIGGVLGSLITRFYQKVITQNFVSLFEATIHWETILLVLAVATMIAVLVTAATARTIKRLQPAEILRSL
jgi:ABC-type antimicrobial peptide transport system permease subunit